MFEIMVWFEAQRKARELKRLNRAKAICESYGYSVMEIVSVGGTDYIKAANGVQYKIGRR